MIEYCERFDYLPSHSKDNELGFWCNQEDEYHYGRAKSDQKTVEEEQRKHGKCCLFPPVPNHMGSE